MAQKILIKTDRNGTKYWQEYVTCDRCGGRGWFAVGVHNGELVPSRVDDAICYKCGGSGKVRETTKEYTPEYAAKLADRRAKAAAKKARELEAQQNQEYEKNKAASLEKNGFSQDGETFLFLGNTYEQKNEIREIGGQYNAVLGWHIDRPVEGFQLLRIKFDEVAEFTNWGYVQFKDSVSHDINMRKNDAYNQMNNIKPSEYVGTVGERIEIAATFIRSSFYEVSFGWKTDTVNIYVFTDEKGNILVWKTSCFIDKSQNGKLVPIQRGDKVVIKGRIKEHSEYRDEKQTILTRCKIIFA